METLIKKPPLDSIKNKEPDVRPAPAFLCISTKCNQLISFIYAATVSFTKPGWFTWSASKTFSGCLTWYSNSCLK